MSNLNLHRRKMHGIPKGITLGELRATVPGFVWPLPSLLEQETGEVL